MTVKITIGRKITFAFLIILMLVIVIIGITLHSYNKVIQNLEVTNAEVSKYGTSGKVISSITSLIMHVNDYIITGNNKYRQLFEQQRLRVEDYQKELRSLESEDSTRVFDKFCSSSEEIAIVDSIEIYVDSIYTYAGRIFAMPGQRSSSKTIELMEIMDYKFGKAVNRKTTELFEIVFKRIEELRSQSVRNKEQMLSTIYIMFSLALLVCLAFVYLSVQRISRPIEAVAKAADEIAKGDYTQRPEVTTHDEVAVLARSFTRIIDAIEKSYRELDSSKRFIETIYATMPSGLLVIGKNLEVFSVNRSFCELFNMTYQQVVGKPSDVVLQTIGLSKEGMAAIAAHQPFHNLECTCKIAARAERMLKLTLSVIRITEQKEEEVLLVIQDITESKFAEELIKKNEALFRTTLYSIGDAVITTDKQGVVLHMNPVAEQLTGWNESEAQGKSIQFVFNIINEEIRNIVESPAHKVLREGIVIGLANHTLLISKDGKEIPIADSGAPIKNESGQVVGVVLVFRDQTEEREKQKALELSHARLKEAQRMAHIGNWELDLQKNVLYWSDEIFHIFEIDPAKFGASYEAFLNSIHPDERDFVNNVYTESVKNKTPYSIDHRLLMKDGRSKLVHEQCKTFYDDQGHPIRSIGTVQDITERKMVEKFLKEQTRLLENFFENTLTLIALMDKGFNFLRVNQAYARADNRKVSEFPGHNHFEFYPSDVKEVFEEVVKTKKPYQTMAKPFSYAKHPERGVTYWDWTLVPIFDDAGEVNLLIMSLVNVTDRICAEIRLKESEEKYKRMVENINDALIVDDIDGKVTFYNKKFLAIHGFDKTDMLNLRIEDYIAPQYRDEIRERHNKRVRGENVTSHYEYQAKKKNGELFWCEASVLTVLDNGIIVGTQSIVRDITERKKLEKELIKYREHLEEIIEERTVELRQSEDKFRALAENSEDAIMRLDSELKYLYVNNVIAKQTGISAEEFVGKPSTALKTFHNFSEQWEEASLRVFETKQKNRIVFKLPNGIWIDQFILPEFNENGDVDSIITSGRDITAIKEYERRIKKALVKEKELNDLKSRFISMVSHEFRTPLSTILISSELLEKYYEKSTKTEIEENFKSIYKSINHLTAMLGDIITFNKIDMGKLQLKIEPLDLIELGNLLLKEIKLTYKKSPTIYYNFNIKKKIIKTDERCFRQIFFNIVSNAIKYTPEVKNIFVNLMADDKNIILEVKDEGIGISKKELKEIFTPFFRTKNAVSISGSGLGLSITKRTVQALKGKILVESKLNFGTTVKIELPLT